MHLGLVDDPLDEDGEFVTTEPCDGVRRAHALGQPNGNTREETISALVTEGVVDRLEAVKVAEEDGKWEGLTARPSQRVRETVTEQYTVGQAGQWVVERLVDQPFLQLFAIAHVTCVEDKAADRGLIDEIRDRRLGGQPTPVTVQQSEFQES